MSVRRVRSVPPFLENCGEQGRAVAALDWSGTSLGAPENWTKHLQTCVSLILHAGVPMTLLWGKTGIMLHNKAYGELIGKPDFSALGQSVYEAFPHFAPFMHEVVGAVFSGTPVAVRDKAAMLERAGKVQEFWLNHDYSPVMDENGACCAVLAIIKDTTERVRVEQRLNFAQEAGGVGTFEWYPDKGTLDVSDEYRRIWGIKPNVEVTDSMLVGLLHPEDQMKAGTFKIAKDNPLEYVEYRLLRPETGEVRWLARRGRVISADGVAVRRFVGTVTDITERKHADAALKLAEERFRTLAQSMTNQLWTATPDGLLNWCNGRIYDYFAVGDEHMLGAKWVNNVHPEDVAAASAAWAAALKTGSLYETEFRLRRSDGVYRWFITRATPIRDEHGHISYWIGSNTDIEAQKQAERELAALAVDLEARVEARTAELLQTQEVLRQAQKMEAIGNLTGGIAHDFNNLLQVIGGNIQMLERQLAAQPQAAKLATNARKGVERGAHLASQLLAFGRRQALAPKVVNMGRVLTLMEEMLRRMAGAAIDIKTIVHEGIGNCLIDPLNLESAILNLAINARDAMEGAGTLTIEAFNFVLNDDSKAVHSDIQPGAYVVVSVTDTGQGMSKETLTKVFDPFFTTKAQGKGSGLGLSMVYGFVKQSGGHVRIYSEQGEGTSVRLYLPSSQEVEDMLAEQDESAVSGGTETILVVEDDDAVRGTVVALLSELGYKVLKARDALSAIGIIESGLPIDLILSDVMMPGPVKLEQMVQRARQLMPDTKIIFTSGYTEGSIVHSGRLQAGIEFLAKPYGHDVLARKLRSVLGAAKISNPEDAKRPHSLTILLCEDDELIRMNLADILEDFGHKTLEAANGAQALELFEQNSVDILITDVGLPDISGIDLCARIREAMPQLPVIFASGHSHLPGVTLDAKTAILCKPYTMDMIEDAIAAML